VEGEPDLSTVHQGAPLRHHAHEVIRLDPNQSLRITQTM
jgi:hypothetical protein